MAKCVATFQVKHSSQDQSRRVDGGRGSGGAGTLPDRMDSFKTVALQEQHVAGGFAWLPHHDLAWQQPIRCHAPARHSLAPSEALIYRQACDRHAGQTLTTLLNANVRTQQEARTTEWAKHTSNIEVTFRHASHQKLQIYGILQGRIKGSQQHCSRYLPKAHMAGLVSPYRTYSS